MLQDISLAQPDSDDVLRLAEWLSDPEVSNLWYGRGEDGAPIHIGYSPQNMAQADGGEWSRVFEDPSRKIYAIYTKDGQHIGEAQLVIESALQEAQAFIIIGRKDLWHHHYGTWAFVHLLDEAFESLELHRVWVDVPDYNEHALQMCRHLGFVLEGHLRKTHRKDDEWYDSFSMGLLIDEYRRRRLRLMGDPLVPNSDGSG